jgi:hypothetical protein
MKKRHLHFVVEDSEINSPRHQRLKRVSLIDKKRRATTILVHLEIILASGKPLLIKSFMRLSLKRTNLIVWSLLTKMMAQYWFQN